MKVTTPSDLLGLAGVDLGETESYSLSAAEVADFDRATADPEAVYLGLSLVNRFLPELLTVEQFSAGVNVGLERVSFGAPLQGGERLVASGIVLSAAEQGGGVQVVVRVTIIADRHDQPICVADTVSRFFA